MPPGDSRRPVRSPATASRVFSSEAVVITPAENTVRMLNPVGSRIWEMADGQRTVDEIAGLLAGEYDVSAEAAHDSVARFVDELLAKGLLELDE